MTDWLIDWLVDLDLLLLIKQLKLLVPIHSLMAQLFTNIMEILVPVVESYLEGFT